MKSVKVHLVLTDDWELRGDGSGKAEVLQFEKIRELCRIYEQFGAKGTFFVEVMQQLAHIRYGSNYLELKLIANQWEQILQEVYGRGHDVQLHIHPQWLNPSYKDGKWILTSQRSILKYDYEIVKKLVAECKKYLEKVIKGVDKEYRCIAFRSGKWCIAPSPYVLRALWENGIRIDCSVIGGYFIEDEDLTVDFRDCDESFLPYYPCEFDARRVSKKTEPIVESPTFSFKISLTEKAIAKTLEKLNNFRMNTGGHSGYTVRRSKRLNVSSRTRKLFTPKWYSSDLSGLSFFLMKAMLRGIRKKAIGSGWHAVPVVLANHSKFIDSFRDIEAWCRHINMQKDVEVITLRQVNENFHEGVYTPVFR
jgi:hypothetical protein